VIVWEGRNSPAEVRGKEMMKLVFAFMTVAFILTLAATGTTPIAPAGPAYAKNCSQEKCRQNCAGKSTQCAQKCGFCDKQ